MRPCIPAYCLLPTAFWLAGCATIYNPATGRPETVLDTSIEVALGNITRSEMGLTSLNVGRVPSGDLQRVQGIGQRLAAVSDRQDLRHQFGVIEDDEFNAFTLPGGTIYVHSGLADQVSDEELAAVLGHEIGHVAARHVAKSLQAQLGYALLMQVAAGAGMGSDSAQMVNTVYGILRNGFGREDEREADRLGIYYLHRAGYDPQAMVRMLEQMLSIHPEGPLSRAFVWQRTHPLTSERIANARAEIAHLKTKAFCPVCGREYAAGEKFCPEDGTRLKPRSAEAPGEVSSNRSRSAKL